ncbi:MAG TPA: Holliday junction branch migration protein RuvA [Candidatus Doudnabacteria bacterium]|nr:Holliday junction branch migration protein RuvA [Candidatus Doudnabacteria bacterium]
MIAYLKGILLQKTTQYLILEQNGVGYKVFTTPEVLEIPVGQNVALYIYHKSSDDGQTLFGVSDFAGLQFFELLISVTGVGPKMALTIISSSKLDILQQAIINGDSDIFTRMSGVGKKTAERIILELKSKLASGVLIGASGGSSDLFDALLSLGYNPREIRDVVSKVDSSLDTGSQIKEALKMIAKN